jgi:plastocyanin
MLSHHIFPRFLRPVLAPVMLAILGSLPAAAATHVVTQVDMSFSPPDIVINVGDTVQWVWTAGFHTVTNGVDLADPTVGKKFDSSLNPTTTTFSYTFTAPGTVSYFCRPHLLFGMTGTVTVQNASGVEIVPARATLALASAPNPFNPRTIIGYTLPAATGVSAAVHDAAGHLVRQLAVDLQQEAGRHELAWDGAGQDGRVVPAGVYLVTVAGAGLHESTKVTLVK